MTRRSTQHATGGRGRAGTSIHVRKRKKGMILLVAYTSNDKHVLTFTECLLSCLATVTQR